MITRAGLYWYALIVTLMRDMQAILTLVDSQEAVLAARLGNYLLERPVETRTARLKVAIVGILYNIAAVIGRYITATILCAALVGVRLVIPVIGFAILSVGEIYTVYNGAQWVINSFTPYAEWHISGIMHILHIVGTAVVTSILISLYTAVFLMSAVKYQKTFM